MGSRRQFLKLTVASLALLAGSATARLLTRAAQAEDTGSYGRELILLCDSDKEVAPINHFRVTHKGSIKILDVAKNEVSSIDLPFFGHIVNQHPLHAEQVVTFEKWGKRGALVDIKQKKILTMLEPAAGKTFFGHCAFSTDGSTMVSTENNYDESGGLLTFRDTTNFKIVEKYPSYGVVPHECRTPDHGKTIMVVNKGDKKAASDSNKSASNLSWINWKNGKLIKKIEFDRNNNVQYGHCDLSFDGWACVSGLTEEQNAYDLVMFVSPNGEVYPAKLPKDVATKLKGEALSIAFLGRSGLVGVTVTKANIVLLINYKTQELVDAINVPIPNGILPILDGNDVEPTMLVSSHENRNISSITMKNGKTPDVKVMSTSFGGIGTHLSRIYV